MPSTSFARSRWAALGAAVAVSLGAGGIGIGHATTSSGDRPVYIPLDAPCRLADTRPAPNTVGPRTAALGPDEIYTLKAWGTVGNCTLPTGTSALALNVTAVGATRQTNLRFFPAGAPVPTTANLNPTPGAPPTPNAVNVGLDTTGSFSVFNKFGNVAVVVDVVGVYDDHHHDDRYYTKAQVDTAVGAKANSSDVYTRTQVDAAVASKASKTATIIVPAEAFRPVSSTIGASSGTIYGAYVSDGTGTEVLRAPLTLPVGSTITSITYYYRDNSAESLSLDVVSSPVTALSAGFVTSMGFDTAGASSAARSATISGLSYTVRDNTGLAVNAYNDNWTLIDSALTVKGVKVEFTMP